MGQARCYRRGKVRPPGPDCPGGRQMGIVALVSRLYVASVPCRRITRHRSGSPAAVGEQDLQGLALVGHRVDGGRDGSAERRDVAHVAAEDQPVDEAGRLAVVDDELDAVDVFPDLDAVGVHLFRGERGPLNSVRPLGAAGLDSGMLRPRCGAGQGHQCRILLLQTVRARRASAASANSAASRPHRSWPTFPI